MGRRGLPSRALNGLGLGRIIELNIRNYGVRTVCVTDQILCERLPAVNQRTGGGNVGGAPGTEKATEKKTQEWNAGRSDNELVAGRGREEALLLLISKLGFASPHMRWLLSLSIWYTSAAPPDPGWWCAAALRVPMEASAQLSSPDILPPSSPLRTAVSSQVSCFLFAMDAIPFSTSLILF